jgi:GntR family transcriptional regulator
MVSHLLGGSFILCRLLTVLKKDAILHYSTNVLIHIERSGAVILDIGGMEPIYVRLACWLEDEIISGKLKEEERIYSQYQLADMFNINPATAAKSLNILANENVVYKQRGMGMFVSQCAKQFILDKRKGGLLRKKVKNLVDEAKRLSVSADELIAMIKTENDGGEGKA